MIEDSIRVQLGDGRDITRFVKSYQIDSDYTTSTDQVNLSLYSEEPTDLADLLLQTVDVSINGRPQFLGRIETRDIGGDGTVVNVSGRDYISEMVECHIDPSIKISEGEQLGSLLQRACAPVGISQVVDDADVRMRTVRSGESKSSPGPRGMSRTVSKGDMKPEPGQGLYDWCFRIAARVGGCTIQPGEKRSQLVLSKPHYDQEASHSLVRGLQKNTENNIVSAILHQDLSSFPTHVVAVGKLGDTGRTKQSANESYDTEWLNPAETTGQRIYRGRRKPTEGPKSNEQQMYRLHYLRDEQCRSQLELSNLAARHLAEKLRMSAEYEITLQGHSDPKTDALWAIDTIIAVEDEVCGIDEELWVCSRNFSYAEGQGSTTTLRCWRPWSFVI
ncbi:MAG: hypothetical protein ACPG4T_15700 [Nannocystaceae bacterium]